MGGRVGSSSVSRKRGSFTAVLASALLEWVLIFMLFVYGLFGYLITKFARHCELPVPCLLCSRIDKIQGSEKGGFYWDLICRDHKLEMSSLVYCHFHEKLVDVRWMCETCLFSFATKHKSNAETYRLLVGKLGEEDPSRFDEDSSPDGHMTQSLKHCCCCDELWAPRRPAQTLLQTRSIGFDAAELDIPLSHEFDSSRDELVNETKILHPSAATTHVIEKSEDSLVNFGYTELKITSDTESDIQASDNEDKRALISDDLLRDLILDSGHVEPFISVFEDESASNKPLKVGILSDEHSQVSCGLVPIDIIQPHNGPSVESASAMGRGLEELNWLEIDLKPNAFASKELIDVVDHKANPSTNDVSIDLTEVGSTEIVNDNHASNIHSSRYVSTDLADDGTKIINDNHVPHMQSTRDVSGNSTKDKLDISEATILQTSETDKVQNSGSLENSIYLNTYETKNQYTKTGLQMPANLDLNDAYKLAVSTRGRQLSEKLSEQLAGKDSPRVSADLKLLLSQFSQGYDLPGILSPRVSRNLDELNSCDSTASLGMKLLQKRLSLERNDSKNSLGRSESGVELLDWSTVGEIEGESELDRLKRQLEHHRRLMIALLKELEEERNASSIAANETMAMITRLQEEKAALQMEASQDLRMLEEQAEYDMEALDKLNNVVTEKEKEIQDLGAELDYYRIKYPNESFLASDASQDENQGNAGNHSDLFTGKDTHNSKDPCLEVEDEKEYLSECLRNLEQKLNLLSDDIPFSNLTNRDKFEKQGEDSSDPKLNDDISQGKSEMDENDITSEEDPLKHKESRQTLVRRVQFFGHSRSTGIYTEADMADLVNEVSKLSERLQAIEADHSFIERAIDTLKNGEEGLIQEIASHLCELRKIGIRRY